MNTALLLLVICGLAGFGLFIAGIYVLAGLGWALLAGAVSLFCVAGFLQRGMTHGE